MSRVLLTKCSQHAGELSLYTFPLGIMYLASALRRASDRHDVRIHHVGFCGQGYGELEREVERFAPDIVGISAITVEAPHMERAVRAIRDTGFDGPIVAGGPHATAFPEETLAMPGIDYAVLGEGEETFVELVGALGSGRDPRGVAGIAYLDEGRAVRSPERPPIRDPDSLPMPAWDLVDVGEYSRYKSMSGLRTGRYMNLFTSRACPYRCTYCHDIFGKGFRARSPENVLEEVKALVDRHGIEHLEIVDDIFNFETDRSKRILDLMRAEGLRLGVAFPNGLRCDRIDRDFLEKLSWFSFSMFCVAVESASPRIQRMIRKNLDLDRAWEVADMCADLRIYTRGYFMLGFPTETAAEMRRTIDWAARSKLHTAFFFLVIPFRGTALYDQCAERMREKGLDFEDHDYFHTVANVSEVSDEELLSLQRRAYVRLAMSPSRALRVLRDFPDYRLFPTGLKTWMELLGERRRA